MQCNRVLWDIQCNAMRPIANASGSISQQQQTAITSSNNAMLCSAFIGTASVYYCVHRIALGVAFCNVLILQYCRAMHYVGLCNLVVETIGHVCGAPLASHKRVPSVSSPVIMPSSDISSLCHIHRNGLNTWAFNNCYHGQPLFLHFHHSSDYWAVKEPTLTHCKMSSHIATHLSSTLIKW